MTTVWTFGGTALTTYGKVNHFNDNYDLPMRRGSDIILPYQPGQMFVPKQFDSRKLLFTIKYQGASYSALETNNDSLKQLLAVRTEQTLSQTREDATVRTIQATVNRPLQIDLSNGNKTAFYVIEFVCAFPYFRLSTAIADNTTTINANPKAMTVTNPGTVDEQDATIIWTGPLSNTVITNSTNGYTLTYTGTIASPRVVTIQKSGREWTATTDLGANVISNISHSGGSSYMRFEAGTNTLSIADSTHSTGTVKVSFNAPFI